MRTPFAVNLAHRTFAVQPTRTPAGIGDPCRVMIILLGGTHDPAAPFGIICDADDSAGCQ